jgi:hypothetical protein
MGSTQFIKNPRQQPGPNGVAAANAERSDVRVGKLVQLLACELELIENVQYSPEEDCSLGSELDPGMISIEQSDAIRIL